MQCLHLATTINPYETVREVHLWLSAKSVEERRTDNLASQKTSSVICAKKVALKEEKEQR